MKKIIILFGVLLIAAISFATIHIPEGDVSGVWTYANSPYIIDGEITIPADSLLIIEPGIKVIFTGHYKFNVQGQLMAVGTEMDLITFTIRDTTGFSNVVIPDGGWHGIRFDNTPASNDSSKIVYCKIEFGKAIGVGENSGGAIYVNNFSKLLVSNSLISNNRALFIACTGGKGAGIYCEQADIIIKDNTIKDNLSYFGSGGGIYCKYANPVITGNIISNNSALLTGARGGGIYCYFSNPIIIDNIITDNIAIGTGSAGGGICSGYGSNPFISNNTISGNYISGTGSAGGGISVYHGINVMITRNSIVNNTASFGGGIRCYDSSVNILNNLITSTVLGSGISTNHSKTIIRNNFIIDNYTTAISCSNDSLIIIDSNSIIGNNIESDTTRFNYGGAIRIEHVDKGIIKNNDIINNYAVHRGGAIYGGWNNELTIKNNIINNNTVLYDGGAINLWHSSGDNSYINIINNLIANNNAINGDGGGVYCFGSDCNPLIVNNTFAENSAYSGGAIYCDFSNPIIVNSILWDNLPNEIIGYPDVTYSDIKDGYPGEGNINLDPLFVYPSIENYQLITGSPCINAGSPDTAGLFLPEFDLAGNQRIFGDRIDMGAYEYQSVNVEKQPVHVNGMILYQNYPNPFNHTSTISFSLPKNTKHAKIEIYNVKGQLVKQLSIENRQSSIKWDGKDEKGSHLSSGIYFYRLKVGGNIMDTKKCVILR